MRTSMNIPEELLREARRAAGCKTQTMAVILGLQELIRKRRLEELVELHGTGTARMTRKELRALRDRR